MPERIPQSATIRVPLQAYLSSDHVSPATGKTIAIAVSKDGAAYANPSAGAANAVEIGSGSYYVDLSATDTGTLGPLWVRGAEGTIDQVIALYDVVKATNGGLSALPDTACTTNASLITVGTGTAQLNVSAGKVAGVALCDTVTTYTGNTLQTGDVFALANGASGFAAIKGNTAAIVAKLPANAIADETLVIAATSSILAALGEAQTGDVFALLNPMIASHVFTSAALVHAPTGSGGSGDPWATDIKTGGYAGTQAGHLLQATAAAAAGDVAQSSDGTATTIQDAGDADTTRITSVNTGTTRVVTLN
jgi:hypothetical protein